LCLKIIAAPPVGKSSHILIAVYFRAQKKRPEPVEAFLLPLDQNINQW